MISGSVRDAEKPIIIVAPGGLPSVWLRVRGSHDVQSSLFTAAHQQDGYPDATESRCSLSTIQKSLLDGGVHTRLLGGTPSPVPHRALLRGRLVNTVNSRRNSCTFWNVFATEVSTVKLYALRLTSTLVPEILRRAAVEQLAVLLDI